MNLVLNGFPEVPPSANRDDCDEDENDDVLNSAEAIFVFVELRDVAHGLIGRF